MSNDTPVLQRIGSKSALFEYDINCVLDKSSNLVYGGRFMVTDGEDSI